MLFVAAVLLFSVGLMHSLLGGRHLINPLVRRDDFPVLLGSQRNARLTLWVGWHALTLFWWAQGAVLFAMAVNVDLAALMTLVTLATASTVIGLTALLLSRGRHLSWIFFLPLAGILVWQVVAGTGL